jgi:hypothetical protein
VKLEDISTYSVMHDADHTASLLETRVDILENTPRDINRYHLGGGGYEKEKKKENVEEKSK